MDRFAHLQRPAMELVYGQQVRGKWSTDVGGLRATFKSKYWNNGLFLVYKDIRATVLLMMAKLGL